MQTMCMKSGFFLSRSGAVARKDINMLEGPIWNRMIVFALPLAFTGILQQLYNAADVATLGHFVSSNAMAAVGNNVPVIGLIISLCMGLALGANVFVARMLGMREKDAAARAVHTAFVVALFFGLAATAVGETFTTPVLLWLDVPESVFEDAQTYLRVYLLAMPFVAIYNFLAAVFRSKGNTQTPLWALFAASLFNIAGNLFFVLVLGMTSGGVALATVLANALSAGILVVCLMRRDDELKLDLKSILPIDAAALNAIFRIGLPAGIQGMVFSLSNLIIQGAINSLGAEVMAASVAAFTIEINVFCFINAFGLAATTYVSQNYGARNLARCRRATWVSMWLNMGATAIIVALILVFARELLGLFSDSESVIEIGLIRLLLVVGPEPINVLMETVSDAMRGYGYSMQPAMVTLVGICVTRVVWVYTAFAIEPTFFTLMLVYPISWTVACAGLVFLYFRHQKTVEARFATRKA